LLPASPLTLAGEGGVLWRCRFVVWNRQSSIETVATRIGDSIEIQGNGFCDGFITFPFLSMSRQTHILSVNRGSAAHRPAQWRKNMHVVADPRALRR
jgi:hypothetical protein